MKPALIVATLLLLAGCANPPPRAVEGNDRSVIVRWSDSSKGALEVADAHCRQYGRSARYHAPAGDFKIAYDCI